MCGESIHLLTVEDFTSLGVGLADARLLIEKYKTDVRASHLADMVAAVRGNVNKKKRENKVRILYSWHHFSAKTKSYSQVKLSNGGGIREQKFDRQSELKNVFEEMKKIYFPNGKNCVGLATLMLFSLYGGDKMEIVDLNEMLDNYISQKALKTVKFILMSKPMSIIDYTKAFDISDDDSDFEIPSLKASTPKEIIARRNLIADQDRAYEASLKADQIKTNLIKDEQVHEKYLKELQADRKQLLREEPNLADDCTLIILNHATLGRQKRLFISQYTMEEVYNWVGSLSHEIELFELCTGVPGCIYVIDPHDLVSKYERVVLNMRETTSSDFTMNIVMNKAKSSNFTNNKVECTSSDNNVEAGCSTSSNDNKILFCPICNASVPAMEIEEHASACADSAFPNVIRYDSDDDMALAELPSYKSQKENSDFSNIRETLKTLLQLCKVDTENAIKLKIRRHYAFMDFCSRVSKPWVQSKLGSTFLVSFYGEAGIDQGGLSREFFSGMCFC